MSGCVGISVYQRDSSVSNICAYVYGNSSRSYNLLTLQAQQLETKPNTIVLMSPLTLETIMNDTIIATVMEDVVPPGMINFVKLLGK